MTVATQVSENEYVANGVATVYSYTFPILVDTDLIVRLVSTTGAISS